MNRSIPGKGIHYLQNRDWIFRESDWLEAVVTVERPRPQLGQVVLRQVEFDQNFQVPKGVLFDEPEINLQMKGQ